MSGSDRLVERLLEPALFVEHRTRLAAVQCLALVGDKLPAIDSDVKGGSDSLRSVQKGRREKSRERNEAKVYRRGPGLSHRARRHGRGHAGTGGAGTLRPDQPPQAFRRPHQPLAVLRTPGSHGPMYHAQIANANHNDMAILRYRTTQNSAWIYLATPMAGQDYANTGNVYAGPDEVQACLNLALLGGGYEFACAWTRDDGDT